MTGIAKYTKRWFTVLLALVLAFAVMDPAEIYAAVYGKETDSVTVRIGYIDYEGFISRQEDGAYTGYGVEYLSEIAKYTNWNYEYVYDSWENQIRNLEEGTIDFICHAQKTGEREEEYLFSRYSVGEESSVLYIRKDDDRYYYNDFESFEGMKVAVLKESFQNEEFAEYAARKGFSCTFYEYASQTECFAALDSGEVDAVAMGSLALKTEYSVVCRFGSNPFYFMTGKQNQELLEQLDDALEQITVAGSTFQAELYQKYYGDTVASADIVFTREEAEYIQNAGTIAVAFIPNRSPLSGVNDEGEPDGITVDIIKLLEERSGLSFPYEMMPAGMRVSEYIEEHPDAVIAGVLTENPEYAQSQYLMTDSFYSDDVALACLKGRELDLNAPDASYKLAIPRSYMALELYISENYPQFEIILCTSTEECLEMVLDGEADLLAQNVNVITPYLSNPHYEEITALSTFFMDETVGIVASNTEENRIFFAILDKCIATVTDKEVSQITLDHTLTNGYRLSWQDMVYKFRYPFIVIVALLLAVVALMLAYTVLRRRSYRRLEEKNVQLAEAVAQANHANLAKSQFLARMSHEIRTPMNAIVGLTAIAKNHKEESDRVGEYLDKIDVSSKVLLNIINDVLDMSAIESDKVQIAEKPFELREILASIATVYQTQCRQKGISFQMDIEGPAEDRLIGDGLRLNQVLLNLVSNAYKFTPSGGSITVTAREASVREEKAYYKFTVEDTGEGMTEEMLGRLFLPFEQEGAETAQKYGGSGLRLSIAKNLVELMGGSISCQSKKGEGTIFTVSLPFGVDRRTAEEKQPENGETQEAGDAPNADGQTSVDNAGNADGASAGNVDNAGNVERFDFGGKRVLLAEDTELNAEIVTELLAFVNIEVDHAENGRQAVDMFDASEPGFYAVILMDIQMPVMDGYEAAKAIRASAHADAGTIPIYAMTANAFTEDVSAALNVGMNGHLAKPIDTRLLYVTIRKAVGE